MTRIATFVLGIASWWLTALYFWGGWDARAYVLFFGSFYAVPMAIYAAIADGCAAAYFPKHPTVGFLLFALASLVCFGVFIQFGPGAAVNKPFYTVQAAQNFLTNVGLPTAALIAVYVTTNAVREWSQS
jgi:hypothetical protein